MAMRAQPVEFIDDDDFHSLAIIRRVVFSISRKFQPANITGIFGSRGSGRTSILNMCKDFASRNSSSNDQNTTLWLKPFDSWKMAGMGNLNQALLWHIHRNLPEKAAKDEKVLYKLGRISVALNALAGQGSSLGTTTFSHSDTVRNFDLISKTLPPDRKSSVSSQFSACEQIDELTESFKSLGKQLVELCGCNILVIPIDDLDKCTPLEAVQLLFILRVMITSETLSFVITTDDNILSKFINISYGSVFTDKQAYDSFLSFFNDWVRVPSPSLSTILRKVDLPISIRDQFLAHLAKTGFEAIFPVTASIRQGCRRFVLYIYNNSRNSSKTITDHRAWLGWFLINELIPGVTLEILNNHNPEQFLDKLVPPPPPEKPARTITTEKKETHTKIVLTQTRKKSETAGNVPPVNDICDTLLYRFVSSLNASMDNATLVKRLREVYPFL